MADFDTVKFWNEQKEELHGHIDTVYRRLGDTFPDAKIGHFGILIRDEWGDASIRMAENIDWYVHNKLSIKLLNLNDFVDNTHFKRDRVHLNNKGFRLFMDQIFSSLLNSFLQKEMVRQRRKRQEDDRRLKDLARERHASQQNHAGRHSTHQPYQRYPQSSYHYQDSYCYQTPYHAQYQWLYWY